MHQRTAGGGAGGQISAGIDNPLHRCRPFVATAGYVAPERCAFGVETGPALVAAAR